MKNNFDKTYEKIMRSTNLINEDFVGDVFSGASTGGAAGATLGAIGGTAVGLPAPMAAGAGMVIGIPIGAIAGTGIWLKNLIEKHFCKKEDESKINELIRKLDDKSFSIKDNEELNKIFEKYNDAETAENADDTDDVKK